MFATENDAVQWIKAFANGLQLEHRKRGNYWRIYDADGMILTEERIWRIEDSVNDA